MAILNLGAIIVLSFVAVPDNQLRPIGFKAELLVDARDVLVGDVVVTKLRVVNQDRVALPLWSRDVVGSGHTRYEFRRDDEKWREYRLFGVADAGAVAGMRYGFRLGPGECQSELLTWACNEHHRSIFEKPGTYRLRATYSTAIGAIMTPEVTITVGRPQTGSSVDRRDYPLRIPWEFKVGKVVDFKMAEAMESCNSKQLLRDAQRLSDFVTNGMIDQRPVSLEEFLKWVDGQNAVRRDCLLIPMGYACANKLDVPTLREVLKRMSDRSVDQEELAARLKELERLRP